MARKKRSPSRIRLIAACVALIALGGAVYILDQHAHLGIVERLPEVAGGASDSLSTAFRWPGGATDAGDASGSIEVYFAPTHALSPIGVHKQFIRFLEGAERSIYCAFYELQLPEAAEALIAKHRTGVDVAIVSDTHYEDREAVVKCIEAGIPVVFDKRSAFMHNKFCVIDGAHVWTGSTNITENGMFRNNNNALLISSPKLAVNYTNEHAEMFKDRRFGSRSPKNTTYPQFHLGVIEIECYFAPEDGVEEEIVDELRVAGKTIDFMAFSFTSKPIAEIMAERMRAGVRVRGLFERRNASSKHAQDDFLAESGAAVYMDRNRYTMHHKVIIIDANTVITGSYNFSAAANESNDENLLIVHDPAIARKYTAEFERLIVP